jgi:hypothetical protein
MSVSPRRDGKSLSLGGTGKGEETGGLFQDLAVVLARVHATKVQLGERNSRR